MKWEQLVALGKELPGVTLGTWYGTPGLKVGDKGFVRLKEDGKDVVFMLESLDEQEALCEAKPDVFYITDHYRGSSAVLARLGKLRVAEARARLERAWRVKASKKLLAKLDR
jgi:hypothetical protein